MHGTRITWERNAASGRVQLWQDGMVTRRPRSRTHRMVGSTRKARPLPGDLAANSAGSEPAGCWMRVVLAQAPTKAGSSADIIPVYCQGPERLRVA